MNRWDGKVAVVTGASSGIGAAIAEKLVQEGLIVGGFARRKEKVEQLSKKLKGSKGKLHAVKVDITKEDEIIEGFNWSISPGLVKTEMIETSDAAEQDFLKECPALTSEDVADAILYVLATPPHVEIPELTIRPLGETL